MKKKLIVLFISASTQAMYYHGPVYYVTGSEVRVIKPVETHRQAAHRVLRAKQPALASKLEGVKKTSEFVWNEGIVRDDSFCATARCSREQIQFAGTEDLQACLEDVKLTQETRVMVLVELALRGVNVDVVSERDESAVAKQSFNRQKKSTVTLSGKKPQSFDDDVVNYYFSDSE